MAPTLMGRRCANWYWIQRCWITLCSVRASVWKPGDTSMTLSDLHRQSSFQLGRLSTYWCWIQRCWIPLCSVRASAWKPGDTSMTLSDLHIGTARQLGRRCMSFLLEAVMLDDLVQCARICLEAWRHQHDLVRPAHRNSEPVSCMRHDQDCTGNCCNTLQHARTSLAIPAWPYPTGAWQ